MSFTGRHVVLKEKMKNAFLEYLQLPTRPTCGRFDFMRVYFCNDVNWILPVALLHADIDGELWTSSDGCWQLGGLIDVGGVLHDLTQHCHRRQENDKMHPFFSHLS